MGESSEQAITEATVVIALKQAALYDSLLIQGDRGASWKLRKDLKEEPRTRSRPRLWESRPCVVRGDLCCHVHVFTRSPFQIKAMLSIPKSPLPFTGRRPGGPGGQEGPSGLRDPWDGSVCRSEAVVTWTHTRSWDPWPQRRDRSTGDSLWGARTHSLQSPWAPGAEPAAERDEWD